jgi:hypothetical protein
MPVGRRHGAMHGMLPSLSGTEKRVQTSKSTRTVNFFDPARNSVGGVLQLATGYPRG